MQGFILGLANGATCLAYCAPVLLPFLLGEGRRSGQNGRLIGKFLAGRLCGYLLFGLLAWATSQLILWSPVHKSLLFGPAYVALAVVMLVYGLSADRETCAVTPKGVRAWFAARPAGSWLRRWAPVLLPLALGFFTGLNLCPPFLMAFTAAAGSGSLLGSLVFFATFFIGTSIYLLPVSFVGLFSHTQSLRTIGKMAAVLIALYYLFSGILLFVGGIQTL